MRNPAAVTPPRSRQEYSEAVKVTLICGLLQQLDRPSLSSLTAEVLGTSLHGAIAAWVAAPGSECLGSACEG